MKERSAAKASQTGPLNQTTAPKDALCSGWWVIRASPWGAFEVCRSCTLNLSLAALVIVQPQRNKVAALVHINKLKSRPSAVF